MSFPTEHLLVTIANGAGSIEETSIVDALRRANGSEVSLAKVDREKGDKNSLMNKMTEGINIDICFLTDQINLKKCPTPRFWRLNLNNSLFL